MKQYPFLDLKLPNAPYMEEMQHAACNVIASGRYLRGEQTRLFEQEIADLCQAKFCVAVSNGLDALRLIFRAYKELGLLHDGDKVIVPANTYIASVLAVSDNGLQPVLCEPSEATMNLDTEKAESLITPDVKAIMPVHLYGSPCWDYTFIELAKKHGLLIIEDNAQAIGAKASCTGLNGSRMTGNLGHAAGFSFYPTKNLGALGDAGAVVTNDEHLAATVRALANYGSDRRYHNIYKGVNCRIDEIQAAMLRVKIRHLDEETLRRQRIAQIYNETIVSSLVKKPNIYPTEEQVWHQYVIRVTKRDDFREYLLANGVETDIHYATPPHRQPCYTRFASQPLPITEAIANEVVSLPIAHVSEQDAREIATIINGYQP